MFVVITIQDNVLNEIVGVRESTEDATNLFLDTLRSSLSNFEDYTPDDIDNILSEGYEKTGNGSICLLDLSNWEPVICKLCGKETDKATAHRHKMSWVGECCWDERLRSSE